MRPRLWRIKSKARQSKEATPLDQTLQAMRDGDAQRARKAAIAMLLKGTRTEENR